jgi:hypothetical protein
MLEMTDRDTALGWHMKSNLFPPPPSFMISVAAAAIDAANEGEIKRLIELPEGVEFRDGRSSVEAYRIIDSFRLDSFIEQDEYWDD